MLEFEDTKKPAAKSATSQAKTGAQESDQLKNNSAPRPPIGYTAKPYIPTYREMPTIWRPLNWLISILIIADLLLLITAWFHKGELPYASAIREELLEEPVQSPIDEQPFEFEYAAKKYVVEPIAEYQIAGLVTTHNAVGTIFDAYHEADAVDIKDLCIIWGDNLTSNNFRSLKYTSETWTCVVESTSMKVWREFNPAQLSNNHLIAASSTVRDRIHSVRIGDQVQMRGMLINYHPVGSPDMRRSTSTVRTDKGDGACEVFLVQDISILARGTPGWYAAWTFGLWFMWGLLAAKVLIFFAIPLEHYKKFSS